MMSKILTEKRDDILYIDFNSPPVNVLNSEILQEIIDALDKERETKVAALKGSGRVFCAGLDVKDHLPQQVPRMLSLFSALFQKIFEFPGIVVSVVHGGAFGGGCEIAFCSDLLISEKGVDFSQPEIKIGVLPPVGCALYPLFFPRNVANYIVFSGESLKAEELERLGIVNKTFEKEGFFEEAHNFLKKFTKLSLPVLECTKKAANVERLRLIENLEKVNKIYLEDLMKTQDALEGLNAFLEKRNPVWKNK
jgi:cyclohexa-1,5-dienecarbonyl-CoA hydratase